MVSASDRRAAVWLVLVAAAGLAARVVLSPSAPPGEIAYRPAADGRPTHDSVAARAARLARPLGRGERIDLDRAPAEELLRLPRIGPALAARIVADRDARGPFGSLEALDRVAGIGPAVLEAVRPHAAFSSRPSAPMHSAPLAAIVSLNTATENELQQLPGLGPRRARAIVEDRQRRGPYRRVDDLMRVRGIGRETVERLRDLVRVP